MRKEKIDTELICKPHEEKKKIQLSTVLLLNTKRFEANRNP